MGSRENFWHRFYYKTSDNIAGGCFIGAIVSVVLILAIIAGRGMMFEGAVDVHFIQAMRSVHLEEASTHLTRGMEALRVRGLDHGTTALFSPSPDHDIGLWYARVSRANIELARAREKTQSEQAIVLVNVREALFMGGYIHQPSGISSHGYGMALFIWFCAACLSFIFVMILVSDSVQRWLLKKSREVPSGGTPA